jgi:hypothetical protein
MSGILKVVTIEVRVVVRVAETSQNDLGLPEVQFAGGFFRRGIAGKWNRQRHDGHGGVRHGCRKVGSLDVDGPETQSEGSV